MNKTLRIALACFLGAILGATLAIQYGQYFWWVGIIIGSLTGYLSYEFKTVLHACAESWEKISNQFAQLELPSKESVKRFFLKLGIAFAISIGLIVFVTLVGLTWSLPSVEMVGGKFESLGQLCLVSFVIGFVSLIIGGNIAETKKLDEISEGPYWKFTCLQTNSFAFLWMVLMALIWFVQITPDRIVSKFVKNIFLLIHSDIRLLCMTDATLGALIGYACNNPLIGGLAGAIFGIINYWIVSIRWLRLAPA